MRIQFPSRNQFEAFGQRQLGTLTGTWAFFNSWRAAAVRQGSDAWNPLLDGDLLAQRVFDGEGEGDLGLCARLQLVKPLEVIGLGEFELVAVGARRAVPKYGSKRVSNPPVRLLPCKNRSKF